MAQKYIVDVEFTAACPACGHDATWKTNSRVKDSELDHYNNIDCDHCASRPTKPWQPAGRTRGTGEG